MTCLSALILMFQRLDTGQRLALQPFEKGPAGHRDIAEIRRHAGMAERRYRIAATGDRQEPTVPCRARGSLCRGTFAEAMPPS